MVLCAFAIVAPTADAAEPATYWVDTANGNDDADGSNATPFKSFEKAFEVTAAGDKVAVINGSMAGEGFVIPADETVVVPAKAMFQCNGKIQIIGTLEVSGTLKFMGDRSTISGADKTGACNIVINGGATVFLGSTTELIGSKNVLAEGSKLVIAKLEPKDENDNYGYTATLESGKLTLGAEFTVGPNTNITIAEGATVEVNATLTNNGSITNNGTLAIGSSGSVNSSNGTFTNNGNVVLNGSFTGTISGGVVSGDATAYPTMTEGTIYQKGERDYLVFHYVYGEKSYQYGLALNDIAYDGTAIMDKELSVIAIALPEKDTDPLTFSNTESKWYDEKNGSYEGALKADGAPNAGLYEGVVRWQASISAGSDFTGNTLINYLDLTVTKGQYTGVVEIEGWNLGQYDEKVNAPKVTVTDASKKLIPAEAYTVSYEYFSDKECKKSVGTDPLALQPGTYYVKATVVPNDSNYEVKDIAAVEFSVVRASEVEFHPIQDLNDPEKEKAILGGVDPNAIQENIKFNDIGKDKDGKYSFRVSGTVYSVSDKTGTATNPTFTALAGLFGTTDIPTAGYFLAFYIAGTDGQKLDAKMILDSTPFGADGTQVAIITLGADVKNDEGYVFGIFYTPSLQADDAVEKPEAMKTGFSTTVDYDGMDATIYSPTDYVIDASFLNYYAIVLHDNKDGEDGKDYYNDTLTYYRANGKQFTLPSGAGDGFKYWTTEEGVVNDRVFSFGSIMVVGEKYDTNLDGIIDLYATYGSGSEPTPVEPTEGKIIVTGFVQDGKAYFSVYAEDGLAIPAETLTVKYNYYTERGSATGTVDEKELEITQFGTIVVEVPSNAVSVFAIFGDVQSNVFFI